MDRKYREYWLSEREEERGAGMIQWVRKRWQGKSLQRISENPSTRTFSLFSKLLENKVWSWKVSK